MSIQPPCNRHETAPAAQAADDAFQAACIAVGYKSRWDLPRFSQMPKAVQEAYNAKVAADDADRVKWIEWRATWAAMRAEA